MNRTWLVPEPDWKLLPEMVTNVFCGPDTGVIAVMIEPLQFEVTLPFKVKSSRRNVPLPALPLIESVTWTVPVSPFTGTLTGMMPELLPTAAVVPEPTAVPLTDRLQFCGPAALRCDQRLKDVISAWKLPATSKVRLMAAAVAVVSRMAWPEAPPALVQAPVLLLHEELDKCVSAMAGAAVYGCDAIVVLPKS